MQPANAIEQRVASERASGDERRKEGSAEGDACCAQMNSIYQSLTPSLPPRDLKGAQCARKDIMGLRGGGRGRRLLARSLWSSGKMGCNCRDRRRRRRRNRDRTNAFITPLSSPEFYYGRTERVMPQGGLEKSEGNPQSHSCIALISMNAHGCIVIIRSCIAIPLNCSKGKNEIR